LDWTACGIGTGLARQMTTARLPIPRAPCPASGLDIKRGQKSRLFKYLSPNVKI
jgi:hypothetical protein